MDRNRVRSVKNLLDDHEAGDEAYEIMSEMLNCDQFTMSTTSRGLVAVVEWEFDDD